MTRTTTFFLFLSFVIGSSTVNAQEYKIGNGNFGLNFMTILPKGDFAKEVDDVGFGIALDLGYSFDQIPITVGLEGGFGVYSTSTFRVPFSGTVQVVTVEVETSNNIGLGHLFLRFQPQTGTFRPYFEGLVGLGYFGTSSSVKNVTTGEEVASSINSDDVAFSYGAGGGLMFKVYEGVPDEEAGPTAVPIEVLIDARVRFLFGGEATYYKSDAVYQEQGTNAVKFDSSKSHTSTTDLMTLHLGVMVRF